MLYQLVCFERHWFNNINKPVLNVRIVNTNFTPLYYIFNIIIMVEYYNLVYFLYSKSFKLGIKRRIVASSFDAPQIRTAVMDRFMELAKVKFK